MECQETRCMNVTLEDLECSPHIILVFDVPAVDLLTKRLERFLFIQFREEFVDICVVAARRQQFRDGSINVVTLQSVRLYIIDA